MNQVKSWVWRLFHGRVRRVLVKAVLMLLLVDVAFIFLMPILRLLSMSVMDVMDLYDPTVVWIPRRWSWENYRLAFLALEYPQSLRNTVLMAGGAAILQTFACAIVGYGFARFEFPGRDKLFMLVLFAMIVPPHAVIIPMFILFKNLPAPTETGTWLNSYWPFLGPAAVGMGLRGALFVFIFRQFFKGMPWELEDAGRIDGAGPFRIFFNIMLPAAQPAIVVVFLFSFVWHWNDSLQPTIYLSDVDKYFMMQRLSAVEAALENMRFRAMWGTGVIMTSALLAVLPLLILYAFTQRFFVESIERTGLIG
jgi:multiple sugar transport system permease protein